MWELSIRTYYWTSENSYWRETLWMYWLWETPNTAHFLLGLGIHTRAKPHEHTECGKTFKYFLVPPSELILKNMYMYNECGKTFIQLSYLFPSEFILGKSHKCSECGKAFSHNSTLIHHQQKILEKNPMNTVNVGKFCNGNLLFLPIRKHILKRNSVSVLNVGESSTRLQWMGEKFT